MKKKRKKSMKGAGRLRRERLARERRWRNRNTRFAGYYSAAANAEPAAAGVVEQICPACGSLVTMEPYDVGSGPEMSCPACEWCWGADGQPLEPLEPAADVVERFACPRCGKTSSHPEDVKQGYCGRCHEWTAEQAAVTAALAQVPADQRAWMHTMIDRLDESVTTTTVVVPVVCPECGAPTCIVWDHGQGRDAVPVRVHCRSTHTLVINDAPCFWKMPNLPSTADKIIVMAAGVECICCGARNALDHGMHRTTGE